MVKGTKAVARLCRVTYIVTWLCQVIAKNYTRVYYIVTQSSRSAMPSDLYRYLAMPSDSKKTIQSSRSAMPSALYRYLAMPSDSKKTIREFILSCF